MVLLIGGFIGCASSVNSTIIMVSNINYGWQKFSEEGAEGFESIYSGGFLGRFDETNGVINNIDNHVILVNNQNYGDFIFEMNGDESSYETYNGGFIGDFRGQIFVKLLNSINRGSIKGAFTASHAGFGGIAGQLSVYFPSIVRGNVNHANIKVKRLRQCLLAGTIMPLVSLENMSLGDLQPLWMMRISEM